MKNVSIIAVLIIILGFGYFSLNKNQESDKSPELANESSSETNTLNESEESSEATTENSAETASDAPTAELAGGIYTEYSQDQLSTNADKDIILFFKADWCPSCRALDADIKSQLNEIPSDVAILTVDYDTETELKKKYGVTTQHTLVQVDAEGNLIKKWAGGNRLENVVSEIN